jgi:outer membrane protein assembly factor BamB
MTLFAACLSAALLPAAGKADFTPKKYDWPQWHGPNRNSVCAETGLLKEWPEGGPPKLWTVGNLGGGYSAPSVAAGRIFGMSYRGGQEGVWALEEATGKELWFTPIAKKGNAGYNEGPRCTPTVDGELLYAVGVGGDLACLEAATGKKVWAKNYKTDFGGRMMSGWGFSESPLIDGDKVVGTPGSDKAAVVALNKKTGEVVWKSEIAECGGAGYASIVKAEVAGVPMYLTLMGQSKGLVGVDANTGKFLWNYAKVANRTANIPTSLVAGDLVFCSTGYGAGAALLRLKPTGSGEVKAEEQYFLEGRTFQNHHGGMVLLDGYVYAGTGHNNGAPTCLELKTGKVAWKKDRGPGTGSAAVLYADGNLIFRYENATVALIEASPKGYKEKGTFKIPEPSNAKSWQHPVIANGKLYLRDQDKLHCFNVKAGSATGG